MADTSNLNQFLTDVADAIRTKTEKTDTIPASDFDTEIKNIDTLKGQEVTITPSTSEQTVTPDTDYNAITKATVSAVDNTIDENIVAENIKENVTILGVTGTLTEGEDLDTELTAQDTAVEALNTAIQEKILASGGTAELHLYIQTETPETFDGIWIKSDDFTYTNVRAITDYSDIVASNINILVMPDTKHPYKTIVIDTEIINGLNYEFDAIILTDSENNILYEEPEVYYGNGIEWVNITLTETAPFATATDLQLGLMLDAHYNGRIDLSTVWNIGDERVIHIDELTAPVAGSHTTHVAQDMTFRIIGFNHDTLVDSIGSITKAAVTIECKELLGNEGASESDYLSGSSDGSTYESPSYWNNAYRRTWLNNNFIAALPSTFSTLVKEVVKRNLNGNNTTDYVETNDKAFLLSYPEVFSSTYSYYRGGSALKDYEGTQYEYYTNNDSNTGRKKYWNNNGSASSTSYYYWLRSPSSYGSNYWCFVYSDGSASDGRYGGSCGLAPALSI